MISRRTILATCAGALAATALPAAAAIAADPRDVMTLIEWTEETVRWPLHHLIPPSNIIGGSAKRSICDDGHPVWIECPWREGIEPGDCVSFSSALGLWMPEEATFDVLRIEPEGMEGHRRMLLLPVGRTEEQVVAQMGGPDHDHVNDGRISWTRDLGITWRHAVTPDEFWADFSKASFPT